MKIKTNEATGPALDWMVAKAANYSINTLDLLYDIKSYAKFNPSTDWAQGGPIIEREHLCITVEHSGVWIAYSMWNYADEKQFMCSGPTALIAAMRCFVASKLGDEVEVPEELT